MKPIIYSETVYHKLVPTTENVSIQSLVMGLRDGSMIVKQDDNGRETICSKDGTVLAGVTHITKSAKKSNFYYVTEPLDGFCGFFWKASNVITLFMAFALMLLFSIFPGGVAGILVFGAAFFLWCLFSNIFVHYLSRKRHANGGPFSLECDIQNATSFEIDKHEKAFITDLP